MSLTLRWRRSRRYRSIATRDTLVLRRVRTTVSRPATAGAATQAAEPFPILRLRIRNANRFPPPGETSATGHRLENQEPCAGPAPYRFPEVGNRPTQSGDDKT